MITFAIITCNRLHYFKNCLNSILEFADLDDINLLVLDNNTVEEGFDDYISSLPGSIDVKIFNDRSPNELFRAMNYAIKYAKQHGDPYVNFIQDDYQFLCKNPNYVKLVKEAFDAKPKVGQVQFNMGWKCKSKKMGRVTNININGTNWHLCHNKHVCDNGITRVAIYDKIGMYPQNVSMYGKIKGFNSKGEDWVGRKTRNYKRLMLCEANMGMMIDCAYVRGNKRFGRYFPAPNKYFLKPFSEEVLELMQRNAAEGEMAFIEDWVAPDGWVPQSMGKHSIDPIEVVLEK